MHYIILSKTTVILKKSLFLLIFSQWIDFFPFCIRSELCSLYRIVSEKKTSFPAGSCTALFPLLYYLHEFINLIDLSRFSTSQSLLGVMCPSSQLGHLFSFMQSSAMGPSPPQSCQVCVCLHRILE